MVDQHTSPRTATVPLHLSVTPGFQTEGCSWSCQGCGGRCTLSIGDAMWSQGWLLEMHLSTRIPKSWRCTVQGDAMCQAAYAASMCMETSPFGYPSGERCESFKTIVIIMVTAISNRSSIIMIITTTIITINLTTLATRSRLATSWSMGHLVGGLG